MTNELLAEVEVLKQQRKALIDAFNKSIEEIQKLPHLNNFDKNDIFKVLAKHMDYVIDKYPKIKEIMKED